MKTLEIVDEFRREATKAYFTKKQAFDITQKLFELELSDENNSENDIEILTNAKNRMNIEYFDSTTSSIDELLDSIDVVRLSAEDIAQAIDIMIFEAK